MVETLTESVSLPVIKNSEVKTHVNENRLRYDCEIFFSLISVVSKTVLV